MQRTSAGAPFTEAKVALSETRKVHLISPLCGGSSLTQRFVYEGSVPQISSLHSPQLGGYTDGATTSQRAQSRLGLHPVEAPSFLILVRSGKRGEPNVRLQHEKKKTHLQAL
jgi:hypothetical protein